MLPQRLTALAILFSMSEAALAEPAAGPPAWNDQASVYLSMSQEAAEQPQIVQTSAASLDGGAPAAPIAHTSSKSPSRHLAPPRARLSMVGDGASNNVDRPGSAASRRLGEFGLPTQSMYTIASALAIVIGAFLLFMWALKRGGRGAAGRRGTLPADVVSVLGRVPLAARQVAELLRVGNKLVLVSLTPTGAETLTEVTDPAEVDRLVGLCQQSNPFSTTKAFEQVFQQMSSEPASGGFLGNETLLTSLATPADAYRANRGGNARG
jgi:flagellar biogenesis protein FliO